MDNATISLLAALSGLAGAGIGATAAIYVNGRTVRATTITANRQAWINSLRDELASLVSDLQASGDVFRALQASCNANARDVLTKILFRESKITLLLNPHEDDHIELRNRITAAIKTAAALTDPRFSNPQEQSVVLRAEIESLIRQSQVILKREWERVKRGE